MPGVTADRSCPKCSGKMWDNTASKKSAKAPDYVCKDRDNCDGAVWLKKGEKPDGQSSGAPKQEPKPVQSVNEIAAEYTQLVTWVAKKLTKEWKEAELPPEMRPCFADAQAVAATILITHRKQ